MSCLAYSPANRRSSEAYLAFAATLNLPKIASTRTPVSAHFCRTQSTRSYFSLFVRTRRSRLSAIATTKAAANPNTPQSR